MSTIMRTIWLVRHGMRQDFADPDWRATAERPDDTPLSAEGRIQARETGRFLKDKGVEVIYTSPFLRAVETAGGAAEALGVPIRIEHGLCEVLKAEWFPGQPDYLSPSVLRTHFPTIDPAYAPRVHPVYPEHEEEGEVLDRCRRTVEYMLADAWTSALWVGHGASVGGVAEALIGHAGDACYKMCGLTGWTGKPGNWTLLYSGVEHLSITEDEVKFR